ncbi:S8 family peptidase [Bradyrhizobium yuanmingense]|uniref:S8 family peptidase n=1 Tax=Bradyrhizobium yuanmingense TaxID=108015 RepID=UPI0023BA35B7|nr:S8 family peptidase [Bradyrhizobium yuanmingense]MDF0522355.1 S8 family peptidase [Bradyrhizobium yuanmingense]
MATYQHLPLQRVEGELDRRKRPGFGQPSGREARTHGAKIQAEVQEVLQEHRAKPKIGDVDPALILKVETSGNISEDEWAKIGLTVLANEPGQTLILFADDVELTAFQQKVIAYNGEKPENQKSQPYAALIEAIEAIRPISATDRIGPVLKGEGYATPELIPEPAEFYDVELWPVSDLNADLFVHRVTAVLEQFEGVVVSSYRGKSALLMRVQGSGTAVRQLLELPEIASIDRPPTPDWPDLPASNIELGDLPEILPPENGALTIGIIDSGLTSAHPLIIGSLAAAFGEPASLGDSDEKGHGTSVSGIAIFGDVRQRLSETPFRAKFRVASARVVNAAGRFDDEELVPTQMENSIRKLTTELGCRVINISLGDIKRSAGSKPSAWAATLDALARELDVLIVVSAGNSSPAYLASLGDGVVAAYPRFLLHEANRILEPASAVNVLTVGSIAHSNGLSTIDAENVGVRSIAQTFQPSPFTRAGPGTNKVLKPDLVDFGGTAVYDGPTQRLQSGSARASAGILSTHHEYLQQLLRYYSGTSFAAPLVAYKAALVFESLPNASANLVRALLALSAEHPTAIDHSFGDDDAIFNLLGYGLPDIAKALESEDNRVVLIAEDVLSADKFAVYEVPIPDVFQTKGARQIRVALSFDPPVKHTRLDYAGLKMGFHLIRGASASDVFDAFRKWEANEGHAFRIKESLKCDLKPGAQRRERGTLQCATFSMTTNSQRYGDRYFLAVRCESGWSSEDQRFALAIELRSLADIQLYQRVQERVRIRV